MSSNQKQSKRNRTTSTARRINGLWIGRLLGIFFLVDLVLTVAVVFAMNYQAQIKEFGAYRATNTIILGDYLDVDDYIMLVKVIKANENNDNYDQPKDRDYFCIRVEQFKHTIEYVTVTDGEATVSDITVFMKAVVTAYGVLLLLELLVILFNLLFGIFAIRRKLRPLDQMAVLTSELGQQANQSDREYFNFDEEKVHNLEDAIARITPNGPDCVLHTSDEELKGLEYAINGLLDRMRASYKQQSRFVSDASHELRTPIAVIQGYINMLDRWGKEDPKILAESIEAIKHESEHMKRLVEQLLFLARGDSGRNKFVLEEVDLNSVVKEVYEESLMIDESHIYHNACSDQANVVCADSSMLKQAVRILTDNAAKYTPAHEQIRIGCGMDGEIPYIYVQDNGIGMKDQDASHVFERFYRADNARDSKTGGTGLGLSIAKWIVDRHYGYFKVMSYEEIGTRISIYLPQTAVRREWEQSQNTSG